jgi:ATP-dependent Clp protease ATP-binding subunit ClpX
MAQTMLPKDIYDYLSDKVLGQEEVLQKISVVLYKHVNGIKFKNILLIGNSGTGKTTIMKNIQRFFTEHEELTAYKAMTIMNANTLVSEEGDVNLNRVFKNVENDIKNQFGMEIGEADLFRLMEHATVCLDEVDKISAKNYGKVNVTGLTIQHALLTILEGEKVLYETKVYNEGQAKIVRRFVDTSKMLFVCGGAFEELYEQVYNLMVNKEDDRRLRYEKYWSPETLSLTTKVVFKLKDCLKLADLYAYGMMPQFISRFSSTAILDDLSKENLMAIMLGAPDSPYALSKSFFATFGIDLKMTDEALDFVAAKAAENGRIGARALREVFDKLIGAIEFDPFGAEKLTKDGERPVITIDLDTVKQAMPAPA